MGNALSYSCNGLGDKLLQSCADGDVVAVRQLLQEHSRICFWYRMSDGSTPLHVAAANGQVQILMRIIETASKQRVYESQREAQVAARAVQNMLDARNTLGQSPLMLACKHGRTDVVRLLLAQGANPLFTDNAQHKTCLHYAAQVGWASCCAVLLADTTLLHGSRQILRTKEVRQRDGSMCKFIDLSAHMGYTALHIAASHGHLETTRVLLRCGASLTHECQGSLRTPRTTSHLGRMRRARVTPLHIAAARRNVPMCRAMLQAHASYVASSESAVGGGQPAFDIRNIRDHYEQRPVDIAEALNCPPLAAMLNPRLSLSLATAGHGYQGPLGPQPLADLAARALRRALTAQLQSIVKAEVLIHGHTSSAQGLQPGARAAGFETVIHAHVLTSAPAASSEIAEAPPTRPTRTSSLHQDQEERQRLLLAHPELSATPAVGGCYPPSVAPVSDSRNAEAPGGGGPQPAVEVAGSHCRGGKTGRECGSKRESSTADPFECGICLDNSTRVAVRGCGHRLCFVCAAQLCGGDSSIAAICPFCRKTIDAFDAKRGC